jgi:uncharacterized protein (TIGR02996 family)
MTPEEAFIQSIREAPADDAPRLIYADWLEEHGQADRAEFIRIQCQLARGNVSNPELPSDFLSLQARAECLLKSNWQSWVSPLGEIVGPRYDRYGEIWIGEGYRSGRLGLFPRGFVERLSLHAESFIREAPRLSRLTALRQLYLWGAGECAADLAQVPLLSGLSILAFVDYFDAPLKARDVSALASSPFLHGLSRLFLSSNSLGDDGVEELMRAPWLVSVQELYLDDNGLSDRGARALAESPFLVSLRTLTLGRNAFTPAGIATLTQSANLRHLRRLEYDRAMDNTSVVGNRA